MNGQRVKRKADLLAAVSVGALLVLRPALEAARAPSPARAMAEAASALLAGLRPEQRARAAFPWDSPERMQWHFVPKQRSGLPLKQMDEGERKLAMGLLRAGLSEAGYRKATEIGELETVLAAAEKDPVKRDPGLYHLWVFGTPAARGTWGWKFEGHHVSLNFAVVRGTLLATTPAFFGANPAEVRTGPLTGRRVLHAEEDLARELLLSFDEATRRKVVFEETAPKEIVTGAASQVDALAPAGLTASAFSPAQKKLLRRLLDEYASTMPEQLFAERIARIEKAGFDKVHFAWAGGSARGEPHYYRVQGPTFLVEYDNTQSDANHVHTVWRDFAGDFGRDLLREHVRATAHR